MTQARGTNGLLAVQYEETFGSNPATPDTTKVYFESEGLKASRNLISSAVITGTRQPTVPIQGNIDVAGSVATELQAYPGILFAAAAGNVKSEANSGTGEALGTALTTPAGVIDPVNGTAVITCGGAHSLAVGDVVQIAGLTAPTALNGLYCRVMAVGSATVFTARIPLGVSTTWTLGAGTIKKVTTAATTYKHTLKFGGALPSLFIEKGFSDISQYFKYNGCKVSKLSLAATPEGFQKVSFDFSGTKETTGSSAFDSTATDLGKSSFNGFGIGTIEEGGSTIANVTKIDFSIDNALDTSVYVIGASGIRSALPEGTVKVSGTVEALFENLTLYTKAVNSTESSVRVVYNLGTGAGTAGNESFEIKVPELIFKQDAPVISGDKGILVSLPFEAYYQNSSEAAVAQIILKNTQPSV